MCSGPRVQRLGDLCLTTGFRDGTVNPYSTRIAGILQDLSVEAETIASGVLHPGIGGDGEKAGEPGPGKHAECDSQWALGASRFSSKRNASRKLNSRKNE